MPNITKHYSEEERESDRCEDSRIYLAVSRHTVSVCNLLGDVCVAVRIEGGWRLSGLYLLELWSGQYSVYSLEKDFLFCAREVQISNYEVLPELHLIEGLVDESFFPKESPPSLYVVPTLEGIKEIGHFPLVELKQVHYLVVLLCSSPQLELRLVLLPEEEEGSTECLHYSCYLFLKHSCIRVGIDQNHHLTSEVP